MLAAGIRYVRAVAGGSAGDGSEESRAYAVVLRERQDQRNGVLMILESRKEAEDMAFELRRKHLDVVVMGWREEG